MPRKAHTFDETTSINIEDIVIEKETKPKRRVKKEPDVKIDKTEIKIKKEEPKEEEKKESEVKIDKTEVEIKKQEIPSLLDIVKNDHQEETIINLEVPDNKIGLASDHRGYKMKQKLTKYLNKKGYTVIDFGGDGIKGDDYTEFGFKLGNAIKDNKIEKELPSVEVALELVLLVIK